MTLSASILWFFDVDSLVFRIPAWIILVFSFFWYVVPGHALIYGPHLFVVGIWEILSHPFRKRRQL